ncbi:MAG TPA: hypothetical protein VKY19_18310, partial [Ktedonosporobacter sp.]|nr:hypothetical protein [Ktedonosporobacter sp.]
MSTLYDFAPLAVDGFLLIVQNEQPDSNTRRLDKQGERRQKDARALSRRESSRLNKSERFTSRLKQSS